MTVIVCVDDKYGVKFNNRRQSRDGVVMQKICDICKGNSLYMNNYSYGIFKDFLTEADIINDEEFFFNASGNAFCFDEDGRLRENADKIDKIILFRWNRVYPADVHLDFIPENEGWKKTEIEDFAGNSHEKITMEVYER